MLPIISSSTIREIEKAIKHGHEHARISLDLGVTHRKVRLSKSGFFLGDDLVSISKVRDDDKSCYIVENGVLNKLQFFFQDTNFLYKLIPTSHKPILQISGTSMHKKEFIDRVEKDRLTGHVLDSGTGLGYTAIAAARTAKQVTTIEIDRNVIDMARLNPYSVELFTRKNISLVMGDLTEKIKKFRRGEFDYVILDGGTPKSSGTFFSRPNYAEVYRVLFPGGRLYHYLPRHHIRRGRDFGGEVIEMIKNAGFRKIARNTEGSYVVAWK